MMNDQLVEMLQQKERDVARFGESADPHAPWLTWINVGPYEPDEGERLDLKALDEAMQGKRARERSRSVGKDERPSLADARAAGAPPQTVDFTLDEWRAVGFGEAGMSLASNHYIESQDSFYQPALQFNQLELAELGVAGLRADSYIKVGSRYYAPDPDQPREVSGAQLDLDALQVSLQPAAWTGLDWTGLDWTGLGWAGPGWAGLGWAGWLGWAGLGWAGLGWAGLDWTGLGPTSTP